MVWVYLRDSGREEEGNLLSEYTRICIPVVAQGGREEEEEGSPLNEHTHIRMYLYLW